jgi:hypothetical protein
MREADHHSRPSSAEVNNIAAICDAEVIKERGNFADEERIQWVSILKKKVCNPSVTQIWDPLR